MFVSPPSPVRHPLRMKTAWVLLMSVVLTATATVRAASADVRFSHTLSTEEKTAGGLERLNSDQVAVLDALVRRDTLDRLRTSAEEASPTRFSQRLTNDERRNAGFSTVTTAEGTKLDGFVDRFQSAKLARNLLAPPVFLSRTGRRVDPTEAKPERPLHGSFMLSYGWGKGGYSEKTGAMEVNYLDPKGRYSVSIGYSETHVKGGSVYRDPYLFGDPFYRDPFYRDSLYRDPFYRDPLTRDPFERGTLHDARRGLDVREGLRP